MKILFPIGSYYPAQIGGPGNTVYWLTKALFKEGLDVTVTTTDYKLPDIQKNKWLMTDYGRVMYCKTRILYLPIKLIGVSLKELKNSDIVHLSSLFYPISIVVATLGIFLNKKVIWSPRGELYGYAMNSSKSPVKKLMLNYIDIFLSNKIFFHATNEVEVELIKSRFGLKSKVIELPNYMILPTKLERNNNEKYFLFTGRLHPIKGLENVILAFAKSSKFKDSDFKFKIAGFGEEGYADSLKKMVVEKKLNNKIEFLGFVEGVNKEQLYSDAHFLVLPSHSENFGNVVIESLAQGTPVIASKGTPWELLSMESAGFWIDNEPDTLMNCLEEAMDMPIATYSKMRQNAYGLAKNKFDIYENIQKWILAYQNTYF